MRKFDLSLRSSRSSYFATFRHQLTILSKTDALDEEKWLNMLGTFVRSEERRVGKECRSRGGPYQEKKRMEHRRDGAEGGMPEIAGDERRVIHGCHRMRVT